MCVCELCCLRGVSVLFVSGRVSLCGACCVLLWRLCVYFRFTGPCVCGLCPLYNVMLSGISFVWLCVAVCACVVFMCVIVRMLFC